MPQQKPWEENWSAPPETSSQKKPWEEDWTTAAPKTPPANPRRGGTSTADQEQEFRRGDQMDPVPTISGGVRGTVSTSGPNAGKDFIRFSGKPFQTAKGAERGISLDAPPDIQSLLPATNTPTPKTPVQLREAAKPPAQPTSLGIPDIEALQARVQALASRASPYARSATGAAGAMLGAGLGTVAEGGVPGPGTVAGGALGYPAGTRFYDLMTGSRPTTSVAEDVLSGTLQEAGGPVISRALQRTIPAAGSVVGHVLGNEGLGGLAGGAIGYGLGGFERGAEGGFVGAYGAKALNAVMRTPAFQAASAFTKRQVIDLLNRGATEKALGLLAGQASTPVIETAKRALAPQTSALGSKNPAAATLTTLSPEDERAFRQYVQKYSLPVNPDAPSPDFDYRRWWLGRGKPQ